MELSNYKKEGTPCPSGMRSVCHARRARPARPPPQRPGSAPGSPGPPQRPGKGGGQSSGATVRKQHPTGGDRAGRWARRNDGRPCIAWQESLPAGWFVFCLADFFFFFFFWGCVVFKIEGFAVTACQHSSILLRPGQQGTRGASGPRRAPSLCTGLPQYLCSTGSEAAAGVGGKQRDSRLSPVSRANLSGQLSWPAVCALAARACATAENEDGSGFPRAHPRRGDLPRLGGFPSL